MSPVLQRRPTAERLVERLRWFGEAVDSCRGRVDGEAIVRAEALLRRAQGRLAASGDATVVALAGATGSGKSSLFNALVGAEVATVGVRRPTTSAALAARWGEGAASELLDWLGVTQRHTVYGADAGREGLVLLDLPDHDSVVTAHRHEAERLAELVDLVVWVVDPQKYADAVLHQRYLQPLARHAGSMLVVLNQADRLGAHQRDACVHDLGRLLAEEGLRQVPVLGTSATTGEGIGLLQRRLAKLAATKQAAAARLSADLEESVAELSRACGGGKAPVVSAATVADLDRALAEAAGVPAVTEAVATAWRRKGSMATGWPLLAWLGRFRPDPLRRLHLDRWRRPKALPPPPRRSLEAAAPANGTVGRTSLPVATRIQTARVDSAVRALADQAAGGLPRPWLEATKAAARRNADRLPNALDEAIGRADLDLHRHRRWWAAVRVLQWTLIGVVIAGLAWLTWGAAIAYLQLPPPPRVTWFGLPAPTVLAVGGVLAGLILGAASRIGVEVGARRRARWARLTLQRDLSRVAHDLVVAPVTEELAGYAHARAALDRARR